MKKKNGWAYAFWILLLVVLILALAVGLISWAGVSGEEDEASEPGESVGDQGEGDQGEGGQGGDTGDSGSGDTESGEGDQGDDNTPAATATSVYLDQYSLALHRWESGTATLNVETVVMSDNTISTDETIVWASSNPEVATVTGSGYSATVTAQKGGTAYITASVESAESSACTVTVTDNTVSTLSGLSNALANGGSVALTENMTVSSALNVTSDATIDLNGMTISTSESLSDAANTIEVAEGATLTIADGVGTGSIKNTYAVAEASDNAAAIHSEGDVIVESGTVTSSSVGIRAEGGAVTINGGTIESDYYAIWESKGEVTVTINDGTIEGVNGIFVAGDSKEGYDDYQSGAKTTLIVNGGTVTASGDSAISTNGLAGSSTAIIEINGGTIATTAGVVLNEDQTTVKTSYPAVYVANGTLTITGGTITGSTAVEVRGGTAAISGGTLKAGYYDEDGNLVTGNDAAPSGNGAKTYGYSFSVDPYGKVNRTGSEGFDNTVSVTVTAGMFDGDIYVAKEAQNAVNGSKWQVSLNAETVAEDAPYVVTINMSLGFTMMAYSFAGEQTCESSNDISYYIFSVNYSEVSEETDLRTAVAEGGEVALTQDITLSDMTSSHYNPLTIGNGTDEVEVELDLNGFMLQYNGTGRSSGYNDNTINVNAGATLTIIDNSEDGSGVVDVTGHFSECLYNEGTVVIAGGLFTRSNENGFEEAKTDDITDSSYTIENYGDMTIEDGAVIFNAGDYSTCVRNQYTEDQDNPATLTVNGGKIYGGKYAVGSGSSKSGRYATFTMTGGTLGGKRSEDDNLPYRALNNYDQAIITGGMLLGGNGGAIDVNGADKADACFEGVVIFNEDGGTNHSLTIGDEYGNGPEIIYEGYNPDADPIENDERTADFATGVAVHSGEVDINAGTIKCTDTSASKGYTFMGAYLTNGTLKLTGGEISGDEAIEIDCADDESATVSATITGGTLSGTIIAYAVDVDGTTTNPLTFDGYANAGYALTTVYSDADTVLAYKYTQSRVTATLDGDSRLAGFSPTDITAWYDPSTNTYTIDGASEAFDDDLLNWFWGEDDASSHASCEYITFEICVAAGETLKITTVDGDGVTTKVFAMYGEGVTAKLTDEESNELDEADGVWIIDVGDHDYTGEFKMTIEVIGADGQVSETYYVVIGTITSSVAA